MAFFHECHGLLQTCQSVSGEKLRMFLVMYKYWICSWCLSSFTEKMIGCTHTHTHTHTHTQTHTHTHYPFPEEAWDDFIDIIGQIETKQHSPVTETPLGLLLGQPSTATALSH